MNARPAYATSSFALCERFYNAFLVDGFCELGIAHGLSLDYLCPPTSRSVGYGVQTKNLFGDPELPMWTVSSVPLVVEHPSSIDGSCMISVNVSSSEGMPVEGARVCLQKGSWQTGEVYEVGYTDIGGHLSLWVNPQTPGEIRPYDSGIHETIVGGLQSGVYFVRMESGSFSAIQRFVVIE